MTSVEEENVVRRLRWIAEEDCRLNCVFWYFAFVVVRLQYCGSDSFDCRQVVSGVLNRRRGKRRPYDPVRWIRGQVFVPRKEKEAPRYDYCITVMVKML